MISDITVWVIMSKDRKLIAKGNVRDRHLVPVDDSEDKKRILTYSTKGKATAAFKTSGFYGQHLLDGYSYTDHGRELTAFLEPVEVHMQMVVNDGFTGMPSSGWNRGIPRGGIPVMLDLSYPHTATYDATNGNYMIRTSTEYGIETIQLRNASEFTYWRYV